MFSPRKLSIAIALVAALPAVAFGPAVFAQGAADPGASSTSPPNPGEQALGRAEVIHAQVHIVAINPATNSVTLRGPRGNLADVDVNPALADVSKLRVGDKLNVAYQQALLIHVDRVSKRGVRERIETTAAIPASAGYASSAHRVKVVATVLKIDRKSRLVTLRGPKHQQVLRAANNISLNELKVGDSVQAEFVSAAAVELVRD